MKISNKLIKVNENFQVFMYDNGYMIEIGGRDKNDDWASSKIVVQSIDELIVLIKEAISMERG
jgi:hypothetical protein